VLISRAFIMIMIIFILEDVLDSILLVEILALQGSFCLPAKVFLNFIRSITVESDFLVPDYAFKFIRDNKVLILCDPKFRLSVYRVETRILPRLLRSRSLNVGDIDLDLPTALYNHSPLPSSFNRCFTPDTLSLPEAFDYCDNTSKIDSIRLTAIRWAPRLPTKDSTAKDSSHPYSTQHLR
jgi:hypothetical protein